MELVTDTPIRLSEGAVKELKRLMAEDQKFAWLRLGVKGGGCSGMTYLLSFEEKPADTDKQFDLQGIPSVIDRTHEIYLYGMEVDFGGGLNSRGFTFKNPNASTTCGCGTSFAV